jgi:hypothetical protein
MELLDKIKLQFEKNPKQSTKQISEQESESNKIEYHETLYTEKSKKNTKSLYKEYKNNPTEQRFYRDLKTMENKIDELKIKKTGKNSSVLNNKIDRLLSKKQKK